MFIKKSSNEKKKKSSNEIGKVMVTVGVSEPIYYLL